MQNRIILGCALTLAIAAPFGAQATPLGAKLGAWQTTTTTTTTGMPQMPGMSKEQLDSMTPEQRAMMQNVIKMQQGKPVTMTTKHCVKESNSMDKVLKDGTGNPNCTRKIISQSATRLEVVMSCTKPQVMKMHAVMVAQSSERFTMTSDIQTENGMKTHSVIKSRWLGSSCKGIPDPGQAYRAK